MTLPSCDQDYLLRPAQEADLEAINQIYNHYVENSWATFDVEKHTDEQRRTWFEEHLKDGLPVLVACDKGKVVAWGSASRYSLRCGYKGTVELSLYVAPGYEHKGIGKQLMKSLLKEGQNRGYHAMVSITSADNEPSIRLLRGLGFEMAGCLKEVGRKFDRWLDVAIMQKVMEP